MKLYDHQKQLIDDNPSKHLLAWGTGTGKTLTAIKLAEKYETLVICPKSLLENWAREIEKWSEGSFVVLSKEQFKKKAPTLPPYKAIICDEAHFFSGYTSQMHKSLYSYIKVHKPERVYLLTATPYMSTPWNIYSLARLLGHEWNWMKFKKHFFNDIPMGFKRIPVPKANKEGEIALLVHKMGSTKSLEECVDVPEQTFLIETFDLTKEQRDAIKKIDDVNPLVYWTKAHQICGGSLKGDGYTKDTFYKSEKLSRIKELALENKKMAIICRYNNEIDHIAKTLQKKYNVFKITGATKNRQEVVDYVNSMDKCIVLINAACSEGYNLHSVPIMVFYSYDFSLKNYIQMIGRIQRINNIKKNVYISLVVKDKEHDIDNKVYQSIKSKQNFDIEIYGKQKTN